MSAASDEGNGDIRMGICTIQRDRSPWLVEWLAFHYVVGFRLFYFYAHHCCDDSVAKLVKLSKVLNIQAFELKDKQDYVQLKAYQHCYDTYNGDVDWMAFIDGDEFLYPTEARSVQEVLAYYQDKKLSALAVYWQMFGSNGHIDEPEGLLIDNYTRRAKLEARENRLVKSIVRGGESMRAIKNSHVFLTENGTVDELLRPVLHGYLPDVEPTFNKIKINHYSCQSYNYYHGFKRTSGMADAGHSIPRPDDWWESRDRNDIEDLTIHRFRGEVVRIMAELNAVLND